MRATQNKKRDEEEKEKKRNTHSTSHIITPTNHPPPIHIQTPHTALMTPQTPHRPPPLHIPHSHRAVSRPRHRYWTRVKNTHTPDRGGVSWECVYAVSGEVQFYVSFKGRVIYSGEKEKGWVDVPGFNIPHSNDLIAPSANDERVRLTPAFRGEARVALPPWDVCGCTTQRC
jgi:hypothetical protein